MTGLEKITSRIIADAKANAKQLIAEAEKESAATFAEYAAQADELRGRLMAEAEREATEIMSRARSAATMQARNILLAEKSRLVDTAFSGAISRILSMPDREYLELLSKLLSTALLDQLDAEQTNREQYGEADLPVIERYEVILNAKDRARCGEELVARVRELLNKTTPNAAKKLVLSAESADIEGGLILRCGDIEINCSISMLISSIKSSVEAEVYNALFGNYTVG